ncbi:hypothetical protein CLAFUW4_11581 [Fulvia fulva]|uniref:DUF221-domain-containing protein n=1 Tax=Passalora fulva TaxID=5499 RepID=A0A9Q8PCJ5_PASFU|nr:uncharacterized protein CLAFUR5_10623 [Fulvia fulva]KAK4619650.1 hypothetical protein CLAFUR4_11586 [Fulvia fulva]KAK4620392.1 hypothetical protein CLAFUR0_11595 [Fulvia fulva]UJO20016.1 hypothetical protein CLAFUR5_10623 [Fulvia fulva]WPV17134.1 hypothetical protein CLAFUW4_11581 [Fulvia fulva]WPV32581.1 hypothetical protein CLAFUW7_11585 [Fulvia fulva]
MTSGLGDPLIPRQADVGKTLEGLISNPFIASFSADSTLASLIFSLVTAAVIALLFCFLRPYNSVVYAPRAKYADAKHAPPPVPKGLFAWIPPLIKTKEQDIVERVGLDAAVFMRVNRMLRNVFAIIAVLGCAIIIPANLVGASKAKTPPGVNFFLRMTPQYSWGQTKTFWAHVVTAYFFDGVIIYFLWFNYRHVAKMRREYFNSQDYQRSLHARTLMVTDIPQQFRSDEGIARLTDEVKATHDMPRTAVARNVKDLPDLVEEHTETVKELEEHLAKYLKNPDRLPAKRPQCKPHKADKTYPKGSRVDAIEYLTGRIKELEIEIREVRGSVDKRNALSYGFASYENIPSAHSVAYAARNKAPQGSIIRLAPKPNDLIWKNLKMSKKQRSRQNFLNSFWITLLTIFWVVPNILIAVFLSNLANLGKVWPAFQTNLEQNRGWWALVQGIAAPAITTLFYFYLPSIFRKLCMNAGDVSKTSRERHVARSLYNFFCFNNLIVFSVFSSIFSWVALLIGGKSYDETQPINSIMIGLCTVSPYWISWMLQRNLGAAVDLSQLWTLIWGSFSRRFLSPTPRRLIELSAPQPFDYASYYNYFLFYSTVAISFATIQPLILVVTALYFCMDSFMKKYLLLYVFITKYESGGMFWRSFFNRMLFLSFFGNCVMALVIYGAGGDVDITWPLLAAMVPLPLIIIGFKIYCRRTFDDEIHYYQKGQVMDDAEFSAGVSEEGKKKRKGDRMAVRFGHPVLYKPLITPMVHSRSQHLLKNIYTGRTSADADQTTLAGYSDVYMDDMNAQKPGKSAATLPGGPQGWEIVDENNMDFEHYKNRPEFRDEAGGDGELYGHAADMVRPGTPSSVMTGLTRRAGTFESDMSFGHDRSASGSQEPPFSRDRSQSADSERTKTGEGGVEYPRGYHQTPSNLRGESPAGFARPQHLRGQESREGLTAFAAPVGQSTPSGDFGGYGPVRYGNVPGQTPDYTPGEEDTSYDYFRRGRTQGR